MICLKCLREIGLGQRVFVVPFPAAGEDAFLIVHPACMPNLEGRENVLDGFFVEGSERVFVPRALVQAIKAESGQGDALSASPEAT